MDMEWEQKDLTCKKRENMYKVIAPACATLEVSLDLGIIIWEEFQRQHTHARTSRADWH